MQSADMPVDTSTATALDVKGLVEICIQCCASFKPAQFSLDAHADAFLKTHKVVADSDCAFVRQVLYGTVRYQALLTCFVKAFYHKNRYLSPRCLHATFADTENRSDPAVAAF